jgi:hypothetical protein
MSKKAHAELAAFAENLGPSSGGRGRHSPLFRWLDDRAEAFKRILDETRPSWKAVTEALAKEGLTNGDGKPLTRHRVQKTWYAVIEAKGLRQPQQRPPSLPIAPPRKQPVEDVGAPTPARTFAPAVLRNHTPSATSPALPAQPKQQANPDPDRADRVIEAMLSGASRNRFKTDDGE